MEPRKPAIYFAGPLFTDAERAFNATATAALRALGIEVFLPQEIVIDFTDPNWRGKTFKKDVAGIDGADLVTAIVDGCLVDDGTAWEVGYSFAKGKPVIGIYTDFRTVGLEGKVNLMIEQSCCGIMGSDWTALAEKIKEVVWA